LYYGNKKITTPDLTPEKMSLSLDYVNKILGLNLKLAEVKRLLARMGYGFQKDKVLIPAYRADILHQIDIVEDVAIAYGYENFKEEIPRVATIASESGIELFKEKIASILVGFGFLETSSYSMVNKDETTKKMMCDLACVELENPVNKEFNVLRPWMIPSLLKILSENTHREYPQNLFEIGTVFKFNPKTETKTEEAKRLAVVLCNESADFTKIKQVLQAIFDALNQKYDMVEVEHPSFIPGRVGRVVFNGKKVAYIGEIHPRILDSFNLEMPVAALELNLTDLFNVIKKNEGSFMQ